MKKWIARKLFRTAVRIDITQATEEARILVFVADLMTEAKAPPKKRGRPAGRKDSTPRTEPVPQKKRGRPVGSKNRPKAVAS